MSRIFNFLIITLLISCKNKEFVSNEFTESTSIDYDIRWKKWKMYDAIVYTQKSQIESSSPNFWIFRSELCHPFR